MNSVSAGDVYNADEKSLALLKGPGLARLTVPSDANIYGNVHGGTILKMMEEAGNIVATRYCNNAKFSAPGGDSSEKRDESSLSYAVLARIERMDFILPMMIGEIAELTSEIIFTSPHSLLVEIEVFAENIVKGTKRKTNQGHFWYVPVCESGATVPVPRMTYKSKEQELYGESLYSEQKMERKKSGTDLSSLIPPQLMVTDGSSSVESETVAYSYTCLTMLVGRNDVSIHNYCRGGVLLKLMDECAGIVSAKHCHTNVVTACLHATNFHRMIKLGSLVTVSGRVTFTSNRSLEVEVVDFESPFRRTESGIEPMNGLSDGTIAGFSKQRAVDAFFTYVSIGHDGRAQPVPSLKIKSEEEKERFSHGQLRYESRRRKLQPVKKQE